MVKRIRHGFTLDDCLFGAVKLTKNANPEKRDYGIELDAL